MTMSLESHQLLEDTLMVNGISQANHHDLLQVTEHVNQRLFTFEDGNSIKFWISASCPNRGYYLKAVRDHGGEICLTANGGGALKIADPFRADKLDSVHVSYRFLDACIKSNVLLDPNDYIIKPTDPNIVQNKRTRVKNTFTQKDDEILIQHLHYIDVSASQKTLYKQIAEKYPQHSWQSWRERYYKNLRKVLGPPVRYKFPDNSNLNPEHAAPHHRIKFTAEDDEIIREALQSGQWALQGQHLYKQLAAKYPRHTSQSWRDRAIKYVAPRYGIETKAQQKNQIQDPLLNELLTYKHIEKKSTSKKKKSDATYVINPEDPRMSLDRPIFASKNAIINDPAHSINISKPVTIGKNFKLDTSHASTLEREVDQFEVERANDGEFRLSKALRKSDPGDRVAHISDSEGDSRQFRKRARRKKSAAI